MKLWTKMRGLSQRGKLDTEMAEEMRHHVELQTERNIAAGMDPDEARYAALRQFGNVGVIQQQAREARRWAWLDQLRQDFGYAVRGLAKAHGFTTVVVLTLALGIGANTAIFSVVNSVLLKPLEYGEPQRLVTLLHQGKFPVSPADFIDWKKQNGSFESIAAAEIWTATLIGADYTEAVPGIRFSEDMFKVLQVAPLLGRVFQASDFKSGADRVLVLGHGLWQRRYGADPAIIGKSVTLSGEVYTIVGVMPVSFQFAPFWATHAEMAAPLDLSSRADSRDSNSLRVFARLERGISLEQAQAEMNSICRQLELAYPQTNTGRTVQVDSLLDKTVGPIRDSLCVLMGAVVFVLLIACVNVANLLLARSSVRRKEMAVRAALGASRSRMTRMLLTESAVLAGLGGVVGWGLACLAVEGIKILFADNVAILRERLPRVAGITIDSNAFLFACAITVLTGLIFGVLPALQAARLAQQDGLQDEGRGTLGSRQGQRMRSILVVMEIALALILLTGAGLLLRSFNHLTAIKPGFNSSRVMSMVVSLHGQSEMVGDKREAFYRSSLEKIGALPGVTSASAVNHLPLGGDLWVNALAVEGRPTPKPGERTVAVYRVARAGYFQTMGITLARGRDFGAEDAASTPGVAIINERFARTQWPGEDPIGRRITLDNPEKNPKWLLIVGVVKDVRQKEWIREADNEIYIPFIQSPFLSAEAGNYSAMTIVVRTAADPLALGGAIQQAIRSVNGAAPISRLATLDQVVDSTLWQPRFNLMLTAVFAGVALLLAALGLYGICAYGVVQRTREFGVRLALGAQRRDVLVLVLGQGVRLAGIGLLLGLAGAFGVTRVLVSLLYQVEPTDLTTFLLVPLLLLIVSLFACWLPARRATKVDPMVALRAE